MLTITCYLACATNFLIIIIIPSTNDARNILLLALFQKKRKKYFSNSPLLLKNSRHPRFHSPEKSRRRKKKSWQTCYAKRGWKSKKSRHRRRGGWSAFREARRFDEGRERDWAKDNGCLVVALSTKSSPPNFDATLMFLARITPHRGCVARTQPRRNNTSRRARNNKLTYVRIKGEPILHLRRGIPPGNPPPTINHRCFAGEEEGGLRAS